MNYDNLHELINRYESNIDILYNEEHDELFKWRAFIYIISSSFVAYTTKIL